MHPPVDLDLVGVARLRLLDATPGDVARTVADCGLARARDEPSAVPALTIRFVDRLDAPPGARRVGLDATATPDGLLLAPTGSGRALLPMAQVGGACEVLAQRGGPVPLLIELVQLTALGQGLVPLHGAGFVHGSVGVVVCGWSKGGKTETMVAFVTRGAAFLGDECLYLGADGEAAGSNYPLRLWDWHLRQLPDLERQLPVSDRRRLSLLRAAHRAGTGPLRRARPALERRLHASPLPSEIFSRIVPRARADVVVLAETTTGPDVVVEPADPADVADRMAVSQATERRPLVEAYECARFAEAGLVNPHLETAGDREKALLRAAFARSRVLALRHPYPVALSRLYDALSAAL